MRRFSKFPAVSSTLKILAVPVIALASRTLKNSGMPEAAKEMAGRVTSSGSYHEALGIIMEYVDPVDEQEMTADGGDNRMDEMEM